MCLRHKYLKVLLVFVASHNIKLSHNLILQDVLWPKKMLFSFYWESCGEWADWVLELPGTSVVAGAEPWIQASGRPPQ